MLTVAHKGELVWGRWPVACHDSYHVEEWLLRVMAKKRRAPVMPAQLTAAGHDGRSGQRPDSPHTGYFHTAPMLSTLLAARISQAGTNCGDRSPALSSRHRRSLWSLYHGDLHQTLWQHDLESFILYFSCNNSVTCLHQYCRPKNQLQVCYKDLTQLPNQFLTIWSPNSS
jgi:hypothetical protein